jgi:hypothetical protein
VVVVVMPPNFELTVLADVEADDALEAAAVSLAAAFASAVSAAD